MDDGQSRVSRREKPPPVFGGMEQIIESIDNRNALSRMVTESISAGVLGNGTHDDADELTTSQQYELTNCIFNHHYNVTEAAGALPRIYGTTFSVDAANHRARKAGSDYSLTDDEWSRIIEGFDRSCAYCGFKTNALELEHLVPVCRGGGTEKHNVVPSCRRCNQEKGTKMPHKFIGKHGTEALIAKLKRINP